MPIVSPRSTQIHVSRLLNRLERDAFPAFGGRDLREISSADVLAIVRKVEARGALDVSRRLKQHVSQIARFAIPQGWIDKDSAEVLTDLLKPKPRVRDMAPVGMDELPAIVHAIDQYDGDGMPKRRAVTRAALMFTLLTRHGLPKRAWRDGMNSKVLRVMSYRGRQTVQWFRGIASTWANETECYRPDSIEMALAHTECDDVRGAYTARFTSRHAAACYRHGQIS